MDDRQTIVGRKLQGRILAFSLRPYRRWHSRSTGWFLPDRDCVFGHVETAHKGVLCSAIKVRKLAVYSPITEIYDIHLHLSHVVLSGQFDV